jgi:hypothetical protein
MSTMIFEVYDALKEAGASDEKARAAAEAIASYEDRFNRIEHALDEIRHDITWLRNDVTWLKWAIALGFSAIITLGALMTGMMWNIMQQLPGGTS